MQHSFSVSSSSFRISVNDFKLQALKTEIVKVLQPGQILIIKKGKNDYSIMKPWRNKARRIGI